MAETYFEQAERKLNGGRPVYNPPDHEIEYELVLAEFLRFMKTQNPDAVRDFLELPEEMHIALAVYTMWGSISNRFLRAVAEGDLPEMVWNCSPANQTALGLWIVFFVNHMPEESFGSPEAVKAWHNRGGVLAHYTQGELK